MLKSDYSLKKSNQGSWLFILLRRTQVTYGGGGILQEEDTLTVTDSTISGNKAPFGPGAGVYVYRGKANFSNTTITDNIAATSGGGIYNDTGVTTLTVSNSTFYNNSTDDTGGGIYNASTTTLINNTFSDQTSVNSGDSIYNTGTLNISNNIIANGLGGASNNCVNMMEVRSELTSTT